MDMLNFSLVLGSDLWTKLIDVFANWLTNYGWTIVVFTVALKLVLLPVDIFQRVSTQKQSKVMSAMQPEIDAINQKYGDNKERVNQETAKLYQKYKVNVGGMCLTMLITLAISLTVFLTLFNSIKSYGNEKLVSTYKQVDTAYVQVYTETSNADEALDAAVDKYEELKDQNSWLWVKNVWKGDTKTSQFVDKDTFVNSFEEAEREGAGARYEIITAKLSEQEGEQNGKYILIIVTALVALGTQFLSAKVLAPKGQKLNSMNLIMMVTIPVSLVLFVINSNVVFTLYTITNSLMTAITSTVLSLIFRSKQKGETPSDILKRSQNVDVVEYSRNFKK